MSNYRYKPLASFIEKNKELLDESKFELLYNKLDVIDRALFTELLLEAGIDMLKNTDKIPEYFLYKTQLKNFDIPSHIEIIGQDAFEASKLTGIIIPDNVEYINKNAFNSCKDLQSIKLSKKLARLGMGSFANCISLEKVEFPRGLISIGDGSFSGCNRLSKIVLNRNLSYIDTLAFVSINPEADIIYEGTSTLFNKINIGSAAFMKETVIHCSDKDVYIP